MFEIIEEINNHLYHPDKNTLFGGSGVTDVILREWENGFLLFNV